MYTIWTHRLVVKSANKDNNAAFCKILESCFLVGSKANIQLLIFLATTLDTSVHNLSYSAAATTTRVILGIESALIPDRTSFCAFADSRLRVFLPVTTYVVVEKPDSTKGVGSH